jgi:N-acetylglutamate synthase
MEQTRIQHLEELSCRMWAGLDTRYYDGWLIRMANGYTRRANSVTPMFGSTLPVDAKITYCEQLYRHYDITPVFRINDALTFPADLDAVLERHGYEKSKPSYVQTCVIGDVHWSENAHDHTGDSSDEWLSTYTRLNNVDLRYMDTHREIIARMVPAPCCLSIRVQGEIAAIGLGVLDDDTVGIYDVVVSAEHRGRGLGKVLIGSLLHWGKAHGAANGFLLVAAENTPALRLYAGFGFRTEYAYWYRTASIG